MSFSKFSSEEYKRYEELDQTLAKLVVPYVLKSSYYQSIAAIKVSKKYRDRLKKAYNAWDDDYMTDEQFNGTMNEIRQEVMSDKFHNEVKRIASKWDWFLLFQ